jgi:hypothetical protein
MKIEQILNFNICLHPPIQYNQSAANDDHPQRDNYKRSSNTPFISRKTENES